MRIVNNLKNKVVMNVPCEKKKFLYFLLLFLTYSYCGKSQKINNQLLFYIGPTYSKTNFHSAPNFLTGWYKNLYETKKPTKGIGGHYFGIDYRRKLSKCFGLGIGFSYSVNGQQSPNFYKIKGISEQDLMNKPDYGGTSYRIIYKSYESTVQIVYVFLQKKNINCYSTAGAIFNVYYRVEANNFLISKSSGEKSTGGNKDVYFHATGGKAKELARHFDLGLWRLGFLMGGGFEYNPVPICTIRIEPLVRFYGDLHDASYSNFIMNGKIFNVGCNIGMGINF